MIARLRRRPLLTLAALAGFFFTATTEASGVEPCEYHDGLPAVVSAEGGAQAAAAQPDTDPHAAHAASASADDAAAGGHDAHEGGCSCLGQCGTTSAPLLPRTDQLAVRSLLAPSFVPQPSSDSSVTHRTGGLFLRHLPTAPPLTN